MPNNLNRRTFVFAVPVLVSACASNRVNSIKPRIGVALGGGGTKGFAHVGVLKILEAHNLAPEFVAGTSAGSLVGSLYASGMDAATLQEKSFALDEKGMRDNDWLAILNKGLIKGQRLQDYVNELVKGQSIDKLPRPFAAVATELDTGKRVVFRQGNTGQAVRASCSIPGLFQVVTINGTRYVDGGVVSPVPVDAVREMGADLVVGVDISSKANDDRASDGTMDVALKSITIMGQKLGELARLFHGTPLYEAKGLNLSV